MVYDYGDYLSHFFFVEVVPNLLINMTDGDCRTTEA